MRRGWLGPLLLGFASVVFLVLAFTPRIPGKTLDTTFFVLGIVFFVLALGAYRRLRTPLPVDTDPRLPVSKTPQKRDR